MSSHARLAPALAMEARLLAAGLWRRRGTAGLAVLAIAIGSSVAAALIHVSSDVGRKLSRELRALGPNVLLVPARAGAAGSDGYLDASLARARLAREGLSGAPLLYVVAETRGTRTPAPVPIVGTDLAAARAVHPAWSIAGGEGPTWIGARLAERLGVGAGDRLAVTHPGTGRSLALEVGGVLRAGGPDDDAWWIPLAAAQELSALPGRASLAQARIEGDAEGAQATLAALRAGGGLDVELARALTGTESALHERLRRLMALVTAGALLAGGLCAFGTLTDLALERRRDVALMKALGAAHGNLLVQMALESLAIGVLGGILGSALGLVMADVIGREVFQAPVALRLDAVPWVIGIAMLIAAAASVGPARMALAVEPATALKGE